MVGTPGTPPGTECRPSAGPGKDSGFGASRAGQRRAGASGSTLSVGVKRHEHQAGLAVPCPRPPVSPTLWQRGEGAVGAGVAGGPDPPGVGSDGVLLTMRN